MRHAQIITFGLETRQVDKLRLWTESRGLWLRPTRHVEACLNLLRKGGPDVLVIRLGRDLERELLLLERTSTLFPDTTSMVIGSSDHPPLARLAWDLGASCVLLPLTSLAQLEEALVGWLPPIKA
jgi:DNA-binding NarL/FixJ family response regulator